MRKNRCAGPGLLTPFKNGSDAKTADGGKTVQRRWKDSEEKAKKQQRGGGKTAGRRLKNSGEAVERQWGEGRGPLSRKTFLLNQSRLRRALWR